MSPPFVKPSQVPHLRTAVEVEKRSSIAAPRKAAPDPSTPFYQRAGLLYRPARFLFSFAYMALQKFTMAVASSTRAVTISTPATAAPATIVKTMHHFKKEVMVTGHAIDSPNLVCHNAHMENRRRVRKVKTEETVSYQLGRYEMRGSPGFRRSVFKVEVHLGEYPTVEEALSAWPLEIERLRKIGRESKASKLQTKLDRLKELTEREEQWA